MTDYKEAIQSLYEVDNHWKERPPQKGHKLQTETTYKLDFVLDIARYAELRELNKNLDRIATALEGKAKE